MRPRPLAAAVALLGCAHPPPAQRPALQVAASYTQAATWRPSAQEGALFDEVASVGRASGVALTHDAALTETARALVIRVARDPQTRTPGAGVIQSAAWRGGVTDPIPSVVVLRRAPGAMNDETRRGLRELLASDRPTHVGAAAERVGADEVVVLALSRRRVRLDPVARSYPRGARMPLRGNTIGDARDPVLVVTRPDGRTVETPLGAGPELRAELLLDAPGAWQVELTAGSDQGTTVLANFPVYVDAPVPEVPDEPAPEASTDPAAVAARLLALANDARRAAGLGALQPDPRLEAIARGHSEDMAAHHFVAHASPTTGGPGDRLRAAGYLTGLAMENVARGYSAREIHDGLMASPGHRANLLHAAATNVGVAVVREAGRDSALLVTQVFAEVARPIDVTAAAARLLESLNRARAERGGAPLATHPSLQRAADDAARSFFAHPELSQPEVFQRAARAVQGEAAAFRRISVAGAFGPHPEGAERLEPLLDPAVRAVGVGVAQGDRPAQPPGSVLVVFVCAVPR